MAERPYAVVDVETTGLDPKRHALIEVGVVKLHPVTLETVAEYSSLIFVDPGTEVEAEAMAVNGIAFADLEAAPALSQVMAAAAEIIDGCTIAGHCCHFDMKFLEAGFAQARVKAPELNYHRLDTASLAWPLVHAGLVPSVSMRHLVPFFGLDETRSHRALEDARRCAALLRVLLTGGAHPRVVALELALKRCRGLLSMRLDGAVQVAGVSMAEADAYVLAEAALAAGTAGGR